MTSDTELSTDPALFAAVAVVLLETGHEKLHEDLLAKQTGGLSASSAFQLASRLAKDSLFERAIEIFERIPLADRDESVFFNLALSQSHDMLFDEARGNYFHAIDLHPEFVEAYVHVGLDYASAGQRSLAACWLLKALQLDPRSAEIFYALSEQLLALGFTNTVSGMLASELEQHPESALVKSTEGELALAIDDLRAARFAFDQALRLDPHCVPALIGKGRMASRESDQSSARVLFEKARSLDPSCPASLELGRLDFKNGDIRNAVRHFTAACPKTCSEEIRIEFARALLDSGAPLRALALLEKQQIAGDTAAVHYLLSSIYRKLGNMRDAEREIRLSQKQNDSIDTELRFDPPKIYVQ